MDHNMVLRYNYSNQNRRRRRTNAPPLRAISMAMVVCRCDTECITQCRMTRASPEAIIKPTMKNTHTLLAISMRWYYNAHIA